MGISGSSSKDGYTAADGTWLVQAFQDKVKMADNSMAGLADSIDTMHAAAGFLTLNLKSSQSESLYVGADTVELSSNLDDKQMALQLLIHIEKRVMLDKQSALESLHNILHLIKTTVQKTSNTSVFHDLSIDTYLEMSPDAKTRRSYSDESIAAMAKENKLLKYENNRLNADNTYMNHSEKRLENEKQTLNQIRVNLEDRIKLLEQTNTEKESKLKELMTNKSTLQIDLAKCTNINKSLKHQCEELKNKNKSLEKECGSLTMEYDTIIEKIKTENAEAVIAAKVEEDKYKTNEKLFISMRDQTEEACERMKKLWEIETSRNQYDLEKQQKEIETKAKEINNLKIELQQTAEKTKELLKVANSEHAHQENVLSSQLQSIKSENKSLYERIAYETEDNRIINQLTDKDIAEKNREIESYRKEIYSCQITIQRLEDECSTVTNELESLRLTNKDQDRQKKSNEMEIKHLRTDRKERIANEGIMQIKKTVLEKQLLKLKQESEQLKTDIVRISDSTRSLESSNQCVLQENERMKQELERIKRKKLIQVQLYYQHRGGLMSTVEENLVHLLRSKMESDTVEIEFIKCMESTDIQLDKPLLLLCISASRIGTDAANATQGLTLTPKMSLLIFHHKVEHALPNQASYQVLTGQEYKMLGGIYDLAFLAGRGIYSCALNISSVSSVVNFISTEGVRKPRDSH